MVRIGGVRLSVMLGGAMAALSVSGAGYVQRAEAQVGTQQRSFDIPAGPLSEAALRFSEQAGVQLVLGSDVSEGQQASAAQGRFTVGQALDRILAGTGLEWRYASAGVIAIERPGGAAAAGPDGAGGRVIGTVELQGAQNLDAGGFGRLGAFGAGAGANGSSDPAATEGTGSYTTNGSVVSSVGLPRPLQQTTQSVTVMTNQRLEEQNLTDLNQVMDFTPGITVQTNTSTDQTYISRGFEITSFSIDGGPPIGFSAGREGSIDLAEFDRIEVLRGSFGFNGGIGSEAGGSAFGAGASGGGGAGGVISLIRKRPLNNEQFILELQGGSWENFRVMADATGPVAFDGRLRARAVLTAQDRDFHYDITHETRLKAFGSVEADLSPSTLVRVGGSYQNQKVRGTNGSGLPRFRNGEPLPLPRSACLCWPFDRQELNTSELFGAFEQRFGEKWMLKIDASRARTEGDYLAIRLLTGNGPAGIAPNATSGLVSGSASLGSTDLDQQAFSATLSGGFDLFGLEQQLVVGASRSRGTFKNNQVNFSGQRRATFTFGPGGYSFDPAQLGGPPPAPIPVTLSTADPIGPDNVGVQLPVNFATNLSGVSSFDTRSRVDGAFALLRLEPLEGLHLDGGLRYTKVTSSGETISLAPLIFFPGFGFIFNLSSRTPSNSESGWVPSLAVAYDLTQYLTAYASFNDIFTPQNLNFSLNSDATFDPLPPARGETYEAGLRLKLRDGKLNGHVAYYDTRIRNRAVRIGQSPDPLRNCCFAVGGKSLSHGVDVELNGEVFSGFQLAASYNYNKSRTSGFNLSPGQPPVLSTLFPKHQVKLWTSYDFQSGPLTGLTVAAGVRSESKRSILNVACVQDPCTGAGSTFSYFAYTQKGYAVVDGLLNYRLNDNVELSLNVYNLLDKTYFSQPSSNTGGNFYAPPRSFMLTLRTIVGDRYR